MSRPSRRSTIEEQEPPDGAPDIGGITCSAGSGGVTCACSSEEHLRRVRRVCAGMPESTEKLSHGEPTFFVKKRVFAMFSNNHHSDGHIALLVPAAPGHQEMWIATSPETYYRPPYVGVAGWVGIDLDQIDDEELACHVRDAWDLIATRAKGKARGSAAKRPGSARGGAA